MQNLFCTNCGSNVSTGDHFCPRCGKSITSTPIQTALPPAAPRQPNPNSVHSGHPPNPQTRVHSDGAPSKKIIGIIGVALAFLLTTLVLYVIKNASQSHSSLVTSSSVFRNYDAELSGTYNTEDAIRLNGGGGVSFNPDGSFQVVTPSLDGTHHTYTGTYSISANIL